MYTWAENAITYAGSAGTQTVLIEGENCEADQTLNITVTQEPTAVVTDVSISSTETYTWAVNAITYNGSAGTQTVFVEGENCTADQTLNITVTASIGDYLYGGVVFWIDPTDNTKGLVCTTMDQSTGIHWFNGSNIVTGATASAIGTGQANTTAIVNSQGAGAYAAQLCDDLTLNSYSDWFLPSTDELQEIYTNRASY